MKNKWRVFPTPGQGECGLLGIPTLLDKQWPMAPYVKCHLAILFLEDTLQKDSIN